MSSSKAGLIRSLVDKLQALTIDAEMNILVVRQKIEQLRQIDNHIARIDEMMAEALEQSDTQLDTLLGWVLLRRPVFCLGLGQVTGFLLRTSWSVMLALRLLMPLAVHLKSSNVRNRAIDS